MDVAGGCCSHGAMVQDLLLVLWFQKEDMEGQGDVMAKGLLFRRHVFLFFLGGERLQFCPGAKCHALSILGPQNTIAKNSFKLTLHRKVPLGWQEFVGELDGTMKRIQVELLWFHSQIVIVMAGDEKSLHST